MSVLMSVRACTIKANLAFPQGDPEKSLVSLLAQRRVECERIAMICFILQIQEKIRQTESQCKMGKYISQM